jgi:hypothetical protein
MPRDPNETNPSSAPDGNSPATKGDLRFLKQELKQDLHLVRQDVKRDLVAMEDRLVEKMRDMQTELLRGFASFSEA